jgi:hypothetical protein
VRNDMLAVADSIKAEAEHWRQPSGLPPPVV